MTTIRNIILFTLSLFFFLSLHAQPVPAEDENIPFLMTFGENSETSWGDDDFSQTFFFLIPGEHTDPVYIRVFDPDVGGMHDEINGIWDTEMSYAIYGGEGCWSNEDAQETDPTADYRSGNLLAMKLFGEDPKTDNDWYVFGPFNPTEGEWAGQWNGNIFKIITEGTRGDDGNAYRFYLSTEPGQNKPIEGANAFAYEYTFRMHNNADEVSHIYPFVDDRTITVKLSNFDWDKDGFIRMVSVARRGQMIKVSNEDNWVEEEFKIFEEEKNTSLDLQFIKRKNPVVINNNVVVNIRNQYGELLPFYVIPIGGVPKYQYSIGVRKKN